MYKPTVRFEKLASLFGVITAFFNLPQALEIWTSRHAEGISLVAWFGFALASIFWLFYGAIHKEKALMITFSLTLVFQFFIILGAILYR